MKITINKKTIDLPTCWADVTFSQYLDLGQCGDDMTKIISLFTGIEAETIRKAKIKGLDIILDALGFLKRDKFNMDMPKTILGVKVPKNLETEQIGRFEDAKLILREKKESDIVKAYPELCMTFLMPDYMDASEDEQKAFVERFNQAPCEEVMAVGSFFLVKLIALRLGTYKSFQRPNTAKKKRRRGSTR